MTAEDMGGPFFGFAVPAANALEAILYNPQAALCTLRQQRGAWYCHPGYDMLSPAKSPRAPHNGPFATAEAGMAFGTDNYGVGSWRTIPEHD
jgi:hypothetical protein